MKKILIINAHIKEYGFITAFLKSNKKYIETNSTEIKQLDITDLKFDFIYDADKKPSKDILKTQELITWSNHIIWFYPVSKKKSNLLEAFINQAFRPNFIFGFDKNTPVGNQNQQKRTIEIIATTNSCIWLIKLLKKDPDNKVISYVMGLWGIKKINKTYIKLKKYNNKRFLE